MLHKEAVRAAATVWRRPDLRFHVLTNGQHFTRRGCTRRIPAGRVLWGIPLYAASGLHDEIVGKQGAFARLMESFALLAAAAAA